MSIDPDIINNKIWEKLSFCFSEDWKEFVSDNENQEEENNNIRFIIIIRRRRP
jgi:hypothetical protein